MIYPVKQAVEICSWNLVSFKGYSIMGCGKEEIIGCCISDETERTESELATSDMLQAMGKAIDLVGLNIIHALA